MRSRSPRGSHRDGPRRDGSVAGPRELGDDSAAVRLPESIACLVCLVVFACEGEPPKPEPAADPAPAKQEPEVEAKAEDVKGPAQGLGDMAAAYKDAAQAEPTGGASGDGDALELEVAAADPSAALPPLPTGALAVVGGVTIPMSAFKEIYDLKVAKYAERGRAVPASADRRYRKSIAERLIYHELLKQEAARLGVDYDKAALADRELAQKRGIRDWPMHLQRRGETEASLREMLIAEMRETAILEKEGALALTAAEIDTDYEKIKGNWESPHPRAKAS